MISEEPQKHILIRNISYSAYATLRYLKETIDISGWEFMVDFLASDSFANALLRHMKKKLQVNDSDKTFTEEDVMTIYLIAAGDFFTKTNPTLRKDFDLLIQRVQANMPPSTSPQQKEETE